MLQVTVGDGARHVVLGDKLLLDGSRKGVAPDVGLSVSIEVDTSHTSLGGISSAQEHGVLRHDLG